MDVEWIKARKKALKLSDADIGRAIGRDRSIANRIVNGTLFDLAHVDGLAEVLEVSKAELLSRAGILADGATDTNAEVVKLSGSSTQKPQGNLPVYGTALAAKSRIDGEAIEQTTLNRAEVIDYVKRPVLLNGKKNAYALHIQGSSMHPALPDGDIVVVVADAPLSIGDNVVVYLRPNDPDDDDGSTARAVLVKELVRRTSAFVELRQYSPACDFRIDMDEVIRIDRVLTRREMLS